ncbi:MAG: helix-turn-helix domain-containing protein [Planctomycetes bacterium]|nr:helix-turn-helix domain-containing protein [Planctomycetota bacterium]
MHVIPMAPHQRDPDLPLAVVPSIHRGISPPHAHDFHEVVYIRRGRGIHVIDDRPYPIIAGDIYVMRPGEPHAYHIDHGELHIVNVLITPQLFGPTDWASLCALPGLAPFLTGAEGQRHKLTLPPPHDHAVEALAERIRDALLRRTPGYRLLTRALALELLLTINHVAGEQADGPAAGPVATAIAYLHAHPDEVVAMADLALETGLSANYLGERFKAELGVSVADYLNRLRIDRARELLAGSDRSISDIAVAIGFAGTSYFGKVFRKLTGHTPREYRMMARGG